jgi:hypothetical protein
LRSAEEKAGNKYGLDTVFFWPRLYPILPDGMKNIVDDKRNQLDLLIRFCSVFIIMTAVSVIAYFIVVQNAAVNDFSLAILSNLNTSSNKVNLNLIIYTIAFVKYGMWLVIPLIAWILYLLSYKSLTTLAISYGKAIKVAFDLYRFDLVKALHWQTSSRSGEDTKFPLCKLKICIRGII